MSVPFAKLHGLGNDFVLVDGDDLPPDEWAPAIRWLADRRQGVGCDQVLVAEAASEALADLCMRTFNADGSEAEMCGNGIRAFVHRALQTGRLQGRAVCVETAAGLLSVEALGAGRYRAELGVPGETFAAIGAEAAAFGADADDRAVGLRRAGWPELDPAGATAISLGNPHLVFYVPDTNAVALAELGPELERDAAFPARVNVEFVERMDDRRVRVRVWERGAGATLACGTGACAAAVVGIRRGLVSSPVSVALPGGELEVDWDGTGSVWLSGPAVTVAEGVAFVPIGESAG